MNSRQPHTYRGPAMRLIRSRGHILAAVALAVAASATAYSQGIIVSGISGLQFGTIHPRQGVAEISYNDLSAAQFTVSGMKGKPIRLQFTSVQPARDGGGLHFIFDNGDCRFSLDGGMTWSPFITGPLYQETRFPLDGYPAPFSTILIRVGGTTSLTGLSGMERGEFIGSLRLTATYLDE